MNEITSSRAPVRVGFRRLLIAIVGFSMLLAVGFQPRLPGRLEITTLDGAHVTPARIELLDREGAGLVADDALPVIVVTAHRYLM